MICLCCRQLTSKCAGKREDYLSWDDYFMSVAFLSAKRSKDPYTQVKCLQIIKIYICALAHSIVLKLQQLSCQTVIAGNHTFCRKPKFQKE